jgi:lysyl-tRNA synthetase, class II
VTTRRAASGEPARQGRRPIGPRTRARLLGGAVALAGVLNIVSALTPELRSRLSVIDAVLVRDVITTAAGTTALFGMLLLLLGRGVAQRKRVAMRAAVVLLVLSTVTHVLKGLDVEEALCTGGLALLLILNRRLFVVPPRPSRWRALGFAVAASAAIVFAYGLSGLYLRHSLVVPHLGFVAGLETVGARAIGMSGPLRVHGFFGAWFLPSVTAVAIAAWCVPLLVVLAPLADRLTDHEDEREVVRRMIDRPDGDTLDPFALRMDKRYVFSPDRRAAVAYRYFGGVGLASGDPVGEPSSFEAAVEAFLQLCDEQGWRPAVLGVRGERLAIYERHGLKPFYIGDEALIDVEAFTLEGRPMRRVRQFISQSKRIGLQVEIIPQPDIDPDLRRALVGIAERWRGKQPERGFSMALDQLIEARKVDAMVAVCRTADGTPVAFQRYVRCRAGEALSLDAMRRDPDAPPGVNERMIVEMVDWAKTNGVRVISLNFAAFREVIEEGAELSIPQSAQAWFLRRMDRFFQIKSLHQFNSKFRPRWVARHIVYRQASDLGPVFFAALSAEALLPFDRSRAKREKAERERAPV